ncbi:MAG: ABC transporter ATP-binding protein [Clostridia bacterium]
MQKQLVHMQKVNKIYRTGDLEFQALYDVDFEVADGEFVSILGPSGSGKSTLMNIIGCLDVATSGKYFLTGTDINDMSENQLAEIRNKKIGFVFQNFQLLMRQSALENVMLPLIYNGTPRAKRKKIAIEMLEKVGLGEKIHSRPNQLSGGQQQRVSIARALVTDPAIILADEPTGALDQKTGIQIMELFEELNKDGKTVIMITHNQDIAKRASRIVKILDGHLSPFVEGE